MALFAYSATASICESNYKDDPEDAKAYSIDFLNFIISEYKRIIKQNFKSPIEIKLKAFELKAFVFNLMVEDLIVSIARNSGTEELTEIISSELDTTKISDLTSLLAIMKYEKSLMDNVEIILSKDSIKEKEDIFLRLVICG
jgi:hypothetical protein